MQNPQTLFKLVGVAQPQPSWENSVLIVIDAQKEYESGRLPLPQLRPAVQTVARLLTTARKKNIPIIHVLHEGGTGLFDPFQEGFQSIESVKPRQREYILRKHLPDAFAGTDLHKILESLGGNKRLVLTGFMTHMCITATAFSALNLGYESFVIRDAVATRALPDVHGRPLSPELVNEVALASLKDRVAWVIESAELLERSPTSSANNFS